MSLKCGYSFPDLYFPMVLKTVMNRKVLWLYTFKICSFDSATYSLNINALRHIKRNEKMVTRAIPQILNKQSYFCILCILHKMNIAVNSPSRTGQMSCSNQPSLSESRFRQNQFYVRGSSNFTKFSKHQSNV